MSLLSEAMWSTIVCLMILQQFSSASYLDFPRLNFAGYFRADVSTINNDVCNYNLPPDLCMSWNPFGTGEFHFLNTRITSAVYENGAMTDSDPIVNSLLVSNLLQPPAKLVDVDTLAQMKSTIYGLKLSIITASDPVAFSTTPILEAEWTRSIIAYDIWFRFLCAMPNTSVPGATNPFLSAQGTSKLKNVNWGDTINSIVLDQLKNASRMGQLSVRITLYQYSSIQGSGNFTFGNVVGTIGIAKPDEPLNAGGQRLLSYIKFPNIIVPRTDSCYETISNRKSIFWAYKAPFKMQQVEMSSMLSVDVSNALPMDAYGNIRDLGELKFAFFVESHCCMDLIEAQIDYLEDGWLQRTGGIIDINLHADQLKRMSKSHLFLVRILPRDSANDDVCKVCEWLPSQKYRAELVQVLLKEIRYFIRPMDYIVYRLQRTYNDTANIDFLVTDFGAPAENISVSLSVHNTPVPLKGIIQSNSVEQTNESGIVHFSLQLNEKIPYPRQTKQNCACNTSESFTRFTVDGQLYQYNYDVIGESETNVCSGQFDAAINYFQFVMCTNFVTILAHSDPSEFDYTEPYTWVDHVQPIFEQYYRLYPVMSNILNMSNYSSVILPQNLNLLRLAMSRDFNDPSYMPVTRDLSPQKQQVILRWLNNPMYNTEGVHPNQTEPICIPHSSESDVILEPNPCPALNFEQFLNSPPNGESYDMYYDILIPSSSQTSQLCQWQFDATFNNCTVETLKYHVQQAIELEFATIPLYMTSLYSIVDGCSTEVYSLIRGILMQEMLHMAQVANLLIALDGTPEIDSVNAAPHYPTVGLPGCVLPDLNLTLERASLKHIRDVFMAIEYPHETDVALNRTEYTNATIGQFYMQMNNCISELTEKGINLFSGDHTSKQVQWPWKNNYGQIHIIHDFASAMEAIKEIIEQGEGTNPIDPTDEGNELAHFYRFEEIVCGAFLTKNDTQYSYSGEPIKFQQEGVWPMRNNPSKQGITRGTRAYFETRAFHQVYRNLLGNLQETFGGEPEKITDAITLMESLQVHAKRVMSTKLDPNKDETVGPVFDYQWED